jgi:hypothetical protein
VPDYDVINYGSVDAGYRELCTRCFNTEVAESDGLDGFEHADLAPVELTDCDGQAHLFHFRTRLFGPGIALDAFEVRDGTPAGYQFQVIGESEDDPLRLLARLIERIRRALSIKRVKVGRNGSKGSFATRRPSKAPFRRPPGATGVARSAVCCRNNSLARLVRRRMSRAESIGSGVTK